MRATNVIVRDGEAGLDGDDLVVVLDEHVGDGLRDGLRSCGAEVLTHLVDGVQRGGVVCEGRGVVVALDVPSQGASKVGSVRLLTRKGYQERQYFFVEPTAVVKSQQEKQQQHWKRNN